MATATLRLSMTQPIPLGILALAMQIETAYWMREFTPVITSLTVLQKDVSDLLKRYEIIAERIEYAQHRTDDLLSDIQPLLNDVYNICGDAECDGTCRVCCDGEYLGEEDVQEKYCRRGRR